MRGDRLMRIGAIVTALGMICTLVAVTPLFFPKLQLPSIWWGLAMLTGVGLAIILFGLRRSSKSRSILK